MRIGEIWLGRGRYGIQRVLLYSCRAWTLEDWRSPYHRSGAPLTLRQTPLTVPASAVWHHGRGRYSVPWRYHRQVQRVLQPGARTPVRRHPNRRLAEVESLCCTEYGSCIFSFSTDCDREQKVRCQPTWVLSNHSGCVDPSDNVFVSEPWT